MRMYGIMEVELPNMSPVCVVSFVCGSECVHAHHVVDMCITLKSTNKN